MSYNSIFIMQDKALTEKTEFEEFWHRDVEESIRHLSTQPFIEEAVLLVSSWGFKLADLQVQKKCPGKGIFPWLKFMYSQAECELTGFLGPVHIWQVRSLFLFWILFCYVISLFS